MFWVHFFNLEHPAVSKSLVVVQSRGAPRAACEIDLKLLEILANGSFSAGLAPDDASYFGSLQKGIARQDALLVAGLAEGAADGRLVDLLLAALTAPGPQRWLHHFHGRHV